MEPEARRQNALVARADNGGQAMQAARPVRSVRYPTLDVLRGLALISMVTAHVPILGHPTLSDRLLHSPPWIDGAFYFVALSGVVSGLVHRRLVESRGVGASARKLARRAGFIYLCQVFLVVCTITLASVDSTTNLHDTPTWSGIGGLFEGLWHILRLEIEPNFTGVLSMYVMFLLWAIPVVALLRRGLWWVVMAASVTMYLGAHLLGGFTFAAWSGSFDPAGWQLLFTGGLLIGWSWEHERLAIPAERRRAVVVAAPILILVFLVAAATMRGELDDTVGWMFEKFGGGWLAFVFAGAVIIAGYSVLEWLRRYPLACKLLHPIEILGLKGLPGYMAMVLTILVIASMPQIPRNDVIVVFVIVVAGFAEWGAYRFDRWRRARGRTRAAKAAAPLPVVGTGVPAVPAGGLALDAAAGATASVITPSVSPRSRRGGP